MIKNQQSLEDLKLKFSKNQFLKDLLFDLAKPESNTEALKRLKREYPEIYNEYLVFLSDDPQKSEELTKQLLS